MSRIALSAITFDAGTQIREAISDQLVADYAACMTAGDSFPPVVLFHDGSAYYLADGFHRALASKRAGFTDISADVTSGTKTDALWFALGANRKNGKRLTSTDLQHAIRLAFATWPDKSTTLIAEQVGCTQRYVSTIHEQVRTTSNLPDRVTGKDGKSYPASHVKPKTLPDRSAAAVAKRREQMREMAADGHTSSQIADALDISEQGCRATLRKAGIDVPADRAVGKAKRHDSNRIVDRMVMDGENLTADVNLIDFAALDRAHISAWLRSLQDSRDKLGAFIRRLMKEQQKHEAA